MNFLAKETSSLILQVASAAFLSFAFGLTHRIPFSRLKFRSGSSYFSGKYSLRKSLKCFQFSNKNLVEINEELN